MPTTRLRLRPSALEAVLPIAVPYLGSPLDGEWSIRGMVELEDFVLRVHFVSDSSASFAVTMSLRDDDGVPNIVPWAVVEMLHLSVGLYRAGKHRTSETNEYADVLLDVSAVYLSIIQGGGEGRHIQPVDAAAHTIAGIVAFPPRPAAVPTPAEDEAADVLLHGYMVRGDTTRIYIQPPTSAAIIGLDVEATPERLGWNVDLEIHNLIVDPAAAERLRSPALPTGDPYCQWAVDYTVGL